MVVLPPKKTILKDFTAAAAEDGAAAA